MMFCRTPIILCMTLLALLKGCDSKETTQSYDYIVVGGGTCGLVVANRLSELPDVSILVIEAGASVLNNSNVTDTTLLGTLPVGTSIDWQYKTVNQTYGDNEQHTMNAGKAIGGTSTINGMAYTRAEDVQIDAWQALGNEGWNWKALLPYYLKSEHFQVPDVAQVNAGASYDPAFHGSQGPLKVGWTHNMAKDNFHELLNSTYQSLGVPWIKDESAGKMRGYNVYPKTVDTAKKIREDAARAYYWPIEPRLNLHMMDNTLVNRVLWSNSDDSDKVVASGVEITKADGSVAVVEARREVVLSAGSLKSPVLLELSGIGNPAVLSKHNIPVKVPLPGVGEHLQDQILNLVLANVSNGSYTGEPGYVAYVSASDVFGNQTSSVASSVLSSLPRYAATGSAASNHALHAPDIEFSFQLQYDLIFKSNIPIAELLITPFATSILGVYWGLLPFARGNIHISSANSSAAAIINPNYWMLEWDKQVQVGVARYIRKMYNTEPLQAVVSTEVAPGLSFLPENATDDQWAQYLKKNWAPNNHPVSTAAMLPRSVGGVVDKELMVYGTRNLRVVDASVLPTQVCGHLTSTLYALAERAADIIKKYIPDEAVDSR